MNQPILSKETISGYLKPFQIGHEWVSARHPDYPANSVSFQENRFNDSGETAYYIASGIHTMQAEVPNWQEREVFRVSPTTINCFDLPAWSRDNGVYEQFLLSKKNGGHGLCQKMSRTLRYDFGVTGILYNSEPMLSIGQTGCCLALFPGSGNLVGGTFFVKDTSGNHE